MGAEDARSAEVETALRLAWERRGGSASASASGSRGVQRGGYCGWTKPETLWKDKILHMGVLVRLVQLEIDGFHWFRLVSFHLPGPSIFPKGHMGSCGWTKPKKLWMDEVHFAPSKEPWFLIIAL